ncbi:MAG: hypothetical protein ACPHO4_11040, partial [Longimicrobiales bacterium]
FRFWLRFRLGLRFRFRFWLRFRLRLRFRLGSDGRSHFGGRVSFRLDRSLHRPVFGWSEIVERRQRLRLCRPLDSEHVPA